MNTQQTLKEANDRGVLDRPVRHYYQILENGILTKRKQFSVANTENGLKKAIASLKHRLCLTDWQSLVLETDCGA